MKPGESHPDLLVAGGGVAGVSAALAAARSGCRVVLIEGNPVVGGTAVGGAVGAICGLYRNGIGGPGELLNPGLSEEIAHSLLHASPGRTARTIGKVCVLPFSPAELIDLLHRLCLAEPNLHLMTDTALCSVTCRNGVIDDVSVGHNGVVSTFFPHCVIDATGSGELACKAGAEYELSPDGERQLAGFTVILEGVNDCDQSLPIKVPFVIAKGVGAGVLSEYVKLTVYMEGEGAGEGFLKINIPDTAANRQMDVASEARTLVKYLVAELEELKSATCRAFSHRVYAREGRRVAGHYTLTADDILSGARFPDAVVRSAWPMELWQPGKGASYQYPPDGDYYEIPLRCLKARTLSNLLIAGRCISVTHEAYGSTRVIGTCIPTGEAAGKAAAEMVSKGEFHVS